MQTRTRRPYERKTISKGGALIFGLGLGALLATVAVLVGFMLPSISSRLEYLPYYARTYYRKLVPQPEYLPTPAPTAAAITTNHSEAEAPTQPAVISNTTSVADQPAPLPDIAANNQEDIIELPAATPAAVELNSTEAQIQLRGMDHQWQTWNNCGPATVTMNMSYFDYPQRQAEAAQFLKPNQDDKNVSPYELAAYARSTGLKAIVRQGGSPDQLKTFLSHGLPIIAETWLVHDGDGLGHYRLVTGYDDAAGQFTTFDSLNGPDYKVSYEQFDADWRVFNRLYLVLFPTRQSQLVTNIIGPDMDDTHMYQQLVARAQGNIVANPDDPIAHFNKGEALTRLGEYEAATEAFDRARQLGLHWRRLWYQFTPFEAYYAVGRYQDVLDLADATIAGTGGLEEAYYYQGLARHATGQTGVEDFFRAALAYNPNFTPAQNALNTLLDRG